MVDAGKKRKQSDDVGSEKKKKKVSADSTASSKSRKIKVSSVVEAQASPPIIGIAIPQDTKFNTYSRAPTKRPRHAASDLLLHSTSHRTLDYSAREDKPKGGQPLLKHYIGLFDPASGQLQLVEAKKMVIRGSVRAQQAPEEAMQSQKLSNMSELKTELGQAFGTRKAKKALAAITENAISPRKPHVDGTLTLDSSEKALMDSIKDVTLSVATQQDLQSAIDAAKPVPKGNYEAEDIQDVYRPEDLIGKDILDLIQVNDWAHSVKKNEDIQLRSRFVAHRINRIGSGESAVPRLRLLRYLYFVMLFYLTTRKGKDKGTREVLKKDKLIEELSPAPPPVIESIRRKFSDKGVMRKQHVDLLMTHCCVFACILDNFETDTWDLKEDFGIEQKQMTQYFMEIGAKIKKAKVDGRTDSIAQLKLPLTFPRMRQGRR
ncbi:DNA-directed RNA polymerase I subunit rpa49 [Cytospora paraplurivora]|uniref:DNA-directed RNA polymerase I subunit rpa49 n=1 Tax=Cytospora paraplurivora TaxID=2898453 RepID=A0AAN9YHD1_9PEZI